MDDTLTLLKKYFGYTSFRFRAARNNNKYIK